MLEAFNITNAHDRSIDAYCLILMCDKLYKGKPFVLIYNMKFLMIVWF